MSINMTTKHKMPATSTSLAQIHPQNSKIDQILRRLHIRKQELIESVRLINNNKKMGSVMGGNNGENVQNGQNVQYEQENGQRKRLQKYQDKIDIQKEQINKLEHEHSQTQQKIIGYVEQIQQSEAKLKQILERVTKQYRQMLGIQNNISETNKKYIYHQLYNLQQQLLHSPMSMRKILCKFYLQHNKISQKCYNYQVPVCSLIDYVIKWKLVNKLFGAVINNQCYRNNQRNSIVEKQQEEKEFHCFYTQEEIKSQHSDLSSQEQQSQCEINVPNRSVHDTWLQILKLMKTLQKMEPIHTTIQQNQYQMQMNLGQFVDVSQMEKFAKKSVSQGNQIKRNIKGIKAKMQQQIDKSAEIQQQIKMKEELISCFKDKITKIEADIAIKKKTMQEKAKQRINSNSVKPDIDYEKQLKQVQQAIKYFSIKKQTSNIQNPQEPSSINHLKSMCDFSTTTFLSPIKSTVQRANYLSPNSHIMNSTKRTNYSNMKYSLRNLLSPSKNQTINKMDKKRAWK